MSTRLFVDGSAGTVGAALQPHLDVLCQELGVTQVCLPEDKLKDAAYRQEAMREADLVVLCLPDSESGEAVRLLEEVNPGARILDASATHRCKNGWVYGLPEVVARTQIASAARVANPGCFATACILAGRPLVNSFGESLLSFQGITGYSAGGRKARPDATPSLVQFGKAHRHIPEIVRHTQANAVLTTMVGPWFQGMLVQTYVPEDKKRVMEAYLQAYIDELAVELVDAQALEFRVDPQVFNNTNKVLLAVAGQPGGGCSVAVVLDNLGKGSAGAAALNIRLMLTGTTN